jgi:hypothetical protein
VGEQLYKEIAQLFSASRSWQCWQLFFCPFVVEFFFVVGSTARAVCCLYFSSLQLPVKVITASQIWQQDLNARNIFSGQLGSKFENFYQLCGAQVLLMLVSACACEPYRLNE